MDDEPGGTVHKVNCKRTRDEFIQSVFEDFDKHGYTRYSVYHGVTPKQFSAVHVYCKLCADTLNAHGIDVKAFIMAMKEGFSINHTKETFKHMDYPPIMAIVSGKSSTKDQSSDDPSKVAEIISNIFATKWGIVAPEFPKKKQAKK